MGRSRDGGRVNPFPPPLGRHCIRRSALRSSQNGGLICLRGNRAKTPQGIARPARPGQKIQIAPKHACHEPAGSLPCWPPGVPTAGIPVPPRGQDGYRPSGASPWLWGIRAQPATQPGLQNSGRRGWAATGQAQPPPRQSPVLAHEAPHAAGVHRLSAPAGLEPGVARTARPRDKMPGVRAAGLACGAGPPATITASAAAIAAAAGSAIF